MKANESNKSENQQIHIETQIHEETNVLALALYQITAGRGFKVDEH